MLVCMLVHTPVLSCLRRQVWKKVFAVKKALRLHKLGCSCWGMCWPNRSADLLHRIPDFVKSAGRTCPDVARSCACCPAQSLDQPGGACRTASVQLQNVDMARQITAETYSFSEADFTHGLTIRGNTVSAPFGGIQVLPPFIF